MQLEKLGENPSALLQDEQAQFLSNQDISNNMECCTSLHLGFFFDGTNNNKERDTPKQAHSNVARLFDVFEETSNTVKIYVPGVGTPFPKETGDTGRGYHARAGLAAGWGGEARINWALLQLSNQLYRYFEKTTLIDASNIQDVDLVKKISTDINLPQTALKGAGTTEVEQLNNAGTLGTIGNIIDTAYIEPRHRQRRELLQARHDELTQKLASRIASDKPKLVSIRLSVFGFSRGAAEARVFCNWLSDALDKNRTLAGVPVNIDFLGIFDTVASVGLAQSALLFEGHGGWGQERFLRVPNEIKKVVHLVSGHEVRGSFPLDIVGDHPNCIELVYPGVHSDIGGGYPPGDQGRGCSTNDAPDDGSKLSQVPLAKMYRSAVAAGVPLNASNPRLAPEIKNAFTISPALRQSFNDYVAIVNAMTPSNASTTQAANIQYGLYLRWRRLRAANNSNALEQQPFFSRAKINSPQDAEDLRRANDELRREVVVLSERENDLVYSDGWMARTLLQSMPASALSSEIERAIWGEKVRQWREVKPFWEYEKALKPEIIRLFDDYVHDSRAWFKPFGATNEDVWKHNQTIRMKKLMQQEATYRQYQTEFERDAKAAIKRYAPYDEGGYGDVAPSPVWGLDRIDLDRYLKDGSLPVEPDGRETSSIWGYLRWRTHYSPEDTLVEKAQRAWNKAKNATNEVIDGARKRVTNAAADTAQEVADTVMEEAGKTVKRIINRQPWR